MHAERPEGEPGRDDAANPQGTNDSEAADPQGPNESEGSDPGWATKPELIGPSKGREGGPEDANAGAADADAADADAADVDHGADTDDATDSDATDSGDSGGHEGAYSLLQRGQELMRRRHNAQAAIVLERAARAEPGKGSILEALGRAYYNSGQHDRSRATFEELLDVDPSAHYAHYALGQSLKQLGRAKEARTHLRLAVALSPESALYRAALNRLGPPPED